MGVHFSEWIMGTLCIPRYWDFVFDVAFILLGVWLGKKLGSR